VTGVATGFGASFGFPTGIIGVCSQIGGVGGITALGSEGFSAGVLVLYSEEFSLGVFTTADVWVTGDIGCSTGITADV